MALDFSFSPEHESVRETVRRFCQDEVAPLVRHAEETETFPRELFRKWGDMGLIGARYPQDVGGSGMDKIAECIIREEMSAVCQGFASSWSAHSHLGIWPIWKGGTAAQQERYFRPAIAGRKIAAFGLSEPDGGSNVRALKTRATKVAGGWQLNGSKLYISNAPIADFVLVAARTRPELTIDAISLFIVETNSPGFEVSKLDKESIRSSETGLIHIDNVFVPDDGLLGEREGTYPLILESLSENRVGVAANSLGMARAALEASVAYAGERIVANKRIGDYQAIAHRLADMAADIEATRWLVYYGAWCVDRGTLTSDLAAKVKLVASEAAFIATPCSMSSARARATSSAT